jgi:hypothetical protein
MKTILRGMFLIYSLAYLQLTAHLHSQPTHWATPEELLDKLIFLAVHGDGTLTQSLSSNKRINYSIDPTFITHFLLMHHRFANPGTILLAMQKRIRQLDTLPGDPMIACFAQMRYGLFSFSISYLSSLSRVCRLLDVCTQDYR